MADDADPIPPAHEGDNDCENFFDPYNDLGHFAEQELPNVMYDTNPNLIYFENDYSHVYQNPPPTPHAPEVYNMEVDGMQMMDEPSLNIFCGNAEDVDEEDSLPWLILPNEDTNNYYLQGDVANDNGENRSTYELRVVEANPYFVEGYGSNFAGGNSRLEASTRVMGEIPSHFETGGPSSRPVPVTPTTDDPGRICGLCHYPRNFVTVHAMKPSPATPTIFNGAKICNCCQPLRTLLHSNGWEVMKLVIYGRTGFFCHAILETKQIADPSDVQHQSYILKDLEMEDVRRFIEDYMYARDISGYSLRHDSSAVSSSFYEVLNVGSNINQPPISTMPPQNEVSMFVAMPNEPFKSASEPLHIVGRDESPSTTRGRPRRNTPLAVQRERTGKMTLDDVKMHFDIPIEKAAKNMEVCPTVLKKICRRGGLSRWPYRSINSLQKKIAAFRIEAFKTENAEVRATAERLIAEKEKEIEEIRNKAMQHSKSV